MSILQFQESFLVRLSSKILKPNYFLKISWSSKAKMSFLIQIEHYGNDIYLIIINQFNFKACTKHRLDISVSIYECIEQNIKKDIRSFTRSSKLSDKTLETPILLQFPNIGNFYIQFEINLKRKTYIIHNEIRYITT